MFEDIALDLKTRNVIEAQFAEEITCDYGASALIPSDEEGRIDFVLA